MPQGGGPEGDRGWPAPTPSMGALEQHPWESNGCPGHLLLPSAGMLHGKQTGDQENPHRVHLGGKNKPHSCFHPPFPKESHGTPCEKKGSRSPRHMGTAGSAPAGSGLLFCCQVSSCSKFRPPLSRIRPAAARLFLITLLQTSKVQRRLI